MTTEPTVSVILPTYNRAEYLPGAIDSVLAQSFEDFELLVVDDASTDNTPEVVEQYNDPRLEYHRLETNHGAGPARNRALELVRGDYVTFQDSDDLWREAKLEKQLRKFKSSPPDTGLVYTGVQFVDAAGRTYFPPESMAHKRGDIFAHLLFSPIVNIHCMVRRECFEEAGHFDQDLVAVEDWELWLRVTRKYRAELVEAPLVEWRKLDDKDRDRDRPEFLQDLRVIRDKYKAVLPEAAGELLPESAADRPLYVWGAGLGGLIFTFMSEITSLELAGLIDNNSELWGEQLRGVEIFPPEKISQGEPPHPFVVIRSIHASEIADQLEAYCFEQNRDYIIL